MSKSNYFSGQNVLGQIFSLVPRHLIRKATKHTNSDFSVKKFDTQSHLFAMCYAVMEDITGLRHISDGLLACWDKLGQMGIKFAPPKSTLGDANKNRDSEVFGIIYQELYKYYYSVFSDRSLSEPILAKAYAMDSSTMTLFKEILKAAGRKSKDGNQKGGIKAHVQICLLDELPMNTKFTSAATHDHTFMNDFILNPYDYAIFDKAYVDYKQYAKWNAENIYFVTREKENALSTSIEEIELPENGDFEILLDEKVMKEYDDENKKPQKMLLRRIVIWNEEHKMKIVLLTNNFLLTASQISMLYRKRWRIELVFKQLKQNFPLQYFVGDNVNAIEIQIWCVLIMNLLLTVLKLKSKNKIISFSLIVSMVRQHAMSYLNLLRYVANPYGLRIEYNMQRKNLERFSTQTKMVFNTS